MATTLAQYTAPAPLDDADLTAQLFALNHGDVVTDGHGDAYIKSGAGFINATGDMVGEDDVSFYRPVTLIHRKPTNQPTGVWL